MSEACLSGDELVSAVYDPWSAPNHPPDSSACSEQFCVLPELGSRVGSRVRRRGNATWGRGSRTKKPPSKRLGTHPLDCPECQLIHLERRHGGAPGGTTAQRILSSRGPAPEPR